MRVDLHDSHKQQNRGRAPARRKPAFVACVFLAAVARAGAQGCESSTTALAPSRDLYCIELIAAPGITASGRVALGRPAGGSPFTIDVTSAGQLRYTPTLTVAGLPSPSTFAATAYVVWAAAPVMYPIAKLGVIDNGRTTLPEISLDKFIILLTAEASPNATEPSGRIILRGASPSTRLQPPDLMQFTIGATPEGTEHHHEMAMSDSVRWTSVPMPPGIAMLPAEMRLRPDVAPYLPIAKPTTPLAQPRQLVRLKSGDTLRLTAQIVRRSFKGQTGGLTMFAFNGQYPGPLLQVPQGAEITVVLTNALDQPTTVHWHGVRLDNRNDGVPDLTQPAVAPGARFVYRLRFPDAGIYWYHPHVREDIQQDLGLYGNILVRSPRANYFSPADREEVLMLDDLLLNDDGLVPYGSNATTHALMGRFGNVMLVNGEPRPTISVRKGDIVRFFLTNVSNTRTFNLSIPDARMKLVAADVGNFEREEWVESVVIAPAERYVVHVKFDSAGDVPLLNRVQALDHFYGKFVYETDSLATIRVSSSDIRRPAPTSSFDELRTDTAITSEIRGFRAKSPTVEKSLILSVQAKNLPFFSRVMMQLDSIFFTPVEWSGTMPGMNWASTADQVRWILRDPATGKENMKIDWTFKRGDILKLRIHNERQSFHGMQHPIHLHGQRFLVTAVNDEPNTNLAWKDTVLIPVGSTVDLLVDLSNPGRWMLHCHIAEHLSADMMMTLVVQ